MTCGFRLNSHLMTFIRAMFYEQSPKNVHDHKLNLILFPSNFIYCKIQCRSGNLFGYYISDLTFGAEFINRKITSYC